MTRRSAVVDTLPGLVLSIVLLPIAAQAITLGVQTTGGDPGSSVEVQVFLTGGNRLVAGVQTDVTWDSNCLSVAMGSGDTAACYSNPAIPKNLSTKIRSPSSFRVLFLSISDVEPIKQDTWLFTCQFNIDATTTATRCPVTLVNGILSDSKGGRLPVTAVNGVVQINQPNVPNPGAPAAPRQAASEGCAIATSRPGWALLWLLIIPTLIRRRRTA